MCSIGPSRRYGHISFGFGFLFGTLVKQQLRETHSNGSFSIKRARRHLALIQGQP